jgi:divalent metal cation (Fe/Co/Zn/Cd) transporter
MSEVTAQVFLFGHQPSPGGILANGGRRGIRWYRPEVHDVARPVPAGPDSAEATRRGRRLEYLTIGWSVVEGIVGIAAGIVAGSVSLVGFGIDSAIECVSAGALLWRLRDGDGGERRERIALRLVGVSFLLLAVYVAGDAVWTLVTQDRPKESPVGMALAALTIFLMPPLAKAKRRVAATLRSEAMKADSRQTDLCGWLSAILLAGLGLNALFGWWWADPVAALGMVPIIAKEGWDALRGKACADCHGDPLARPKA